MLLWFKKSVAYNLIRRIHFQLQSLYTHILRTAFVSCKDSIHSNGSERWYTILECTQSSQDDEECPIAELLRPLSERNCKMCFVVTGLRNVSCWDQVHSVDHSLPIIIKMPEHRSSTAIKEKEEISSFTKKRLLFLPKASLAKTHDFVAKTYGQAKFPAQRPYLYKPCKPFHPLFFDSCGVRVLYSFPCCWFLFDIRLLIYVRSWRQPVDTDQKYCIPSLIQPLPTEPIIYIGSVGVLMAGHLFPLTL